VCGIATGWMCLFCLDVLGVGQLYGASLVAQMSVAAPFTQMKIPFDVSRMSQCLVIAFVMIWTLQSSAFSR